MNLGDFASLNFPINEVIGEAKQILSTNNTLVLTAETGAGKSTILPLYFKEAPWLHNKKIIVLEPRRIAAKSIAHRMSELLNTKVGEEVGYTIRFDNRISPKTKIQIITEGILIKILQENNDLSDIGMVIFDEFHERSLYTDLSLALCKEVQKYLRPDLRILIMSATLNVKSLCESLSCELLISKGRNFPVSIKYLNRCEPEELVLMVPHYIKQILKENSEGDILCFLPGESDIRKISKSLKRLHQSIIIEELFGMLSIKEQRRVVMPRTDGKRRIILSTNIAESSLTIEGIRIVLDCGYEKRQVFNSKTSLYSLKTTSIAMDSANQRAGRAGRLAAGICYRMWSKNEEQNKLKVGLPEILEADLSNLVLELKEWSAQAVEDYFWLDKPPPSKLEAAQKLLESFGALNKFKITEKGRVLNRYSCHPRVANMLYFARKHDMLPLATDLAAIIEERDPLQGEQYGVNINYRVEYLRRKRDSENLSGRWLNIEKTAAFYRKISNCEQTENGPFSEYDSGLLIAQAYPDRIAGSKDGYGQHYQLATGKIVKLHKEDDLKQSSWIVICSLDAGKEIGRIYLASPIDPKDLRNFVNEIEVYFWDKKLEKVVAERRLCIGNIVLKSSIINTTDEKRKNEVLLNEIAINPTIFLDINQSVIQLQNRVISLKKWQTKIELPDYTLSGIVSNLKEIIGPYLPPIKTKKDLRNIDLHQVLYYQLNQEQQELINNLCPEEYQIPKGRKVKIIYQDNGDSPIIETKIQDAFGMLTTPSVCNGRIKCLVNLLSPGNKPVQLTSDMENFWDNSYQIIRKELRGRYPKHAWPENPKKDIKT